MTDIAQNYDDLAMYSGGSNFTLRLGEIIAEGYNTDEKLHLDKYPIFDDSKRFELNHKILAHYAMREIGYETVEQFLFALGRRMIEIMPYYNKLYLSERLKFEPLLNMDVTSVQDNASESQSSAKSTSDESSEQTTTGSNEGAHKQRQVDSTTPDAVLSNNGDYASAVGDVDVKDKTTTEAKVSGVSHGESSTDFANAKTIGNGTTHTSGYSGTSGAALLQAYRDTLLNIDVMVILELQDLFMSVADSRDTYSPLGRNFTLW